MFQHTFLHPHAYIHVIRVSLKFSAGFLTCVKMQCYCIYDTKLSFLIFFKNAPCYTSDFTNFLFLACVKFRLMLAKLIQIFWIKFLNKKIKPLRRKLLLFKSLCHCLFGCIIHSSACHQMGHLIFHLKEKPIYHLNGNSFFHHFEDEKKKQH